MDYILKIIKQSHHRNGISGSPFKIGIIEDDDKSRKLIIDFDSNNKLNPFIAVLDMDLLSKNIIEFGLNSWRGDLYEDLLK